MHPHLLGGRPDGEIVTASAPEEFTARLLLAAGVSVTGLDIDVTAADTDELDPQVTVARVGLGGLAGTRHITGPGVLSSLVVAEGSLSACRTLVRLVAPEAAGTICQTAA